MSFDTPKPWTASQSGKSTCWTWSAKSKQDWMERPRCCLLCEGGTWLGSRWKTSSRLIALASPSRNSSWLGSRVLESHGLLRQAGWCLDFSAFYIVLWVKPSSCWAQTYSHLEECFQVYEEDLLFPTFIFSIFPLFGSFEVHSLHIADLSTWGVGWWDLQLCLWHSGIEAYQSGGWRWTKKHGLRLFASTFLATPISTGLTSANGGHCDIWATTKTCDDSAMTNLVKKGCVNFRNLAKTLKEQ